MVETNILFKFLSFHVRGEFRNSTANITLKRSPESPVNRKRTKFALKLYLVIFFGNFLYIWKLIFKIWKILNFWEISKFLKIFELLAWFLKKWDFFFQRYRKIVKISDFGKGDNFFQKVVKFFGNFLYIWKLIFKIWKILNFS